MASFHQGHYNGHKKCKMKVPRLRGVPKDGLSVWVLLAENEIKLLLHHSHEPKRNQ